MPGGSIDDFLSAAKDPAFVRVATARILPPDKVPLLRRFVELEADLDRAAIDDTKLNREPMMPVIAEQLAELSDEIEASKQEFRFRCVGFTEWQKLTSRHPPTKEQRKVNQMADHNPETFQPAAIAASCMAPEMTVEQALGLRDVLTVEQWAELWLACREANMGGGDSPKSMTAGAILQAKERFATMRASGESLDLSSSGE